MDTPTLRNHSPDCVVARPLALGSHGAAEPQHTETLPDDSPCPSHLRPGPGLRAYDGRKQDRNLRRPHTARQRGTSPPGVLSVLREPNAHCSRAGLPHILDSELLAVVHALWVFHYLVGR
jgi:hypothetical protein